jgi:hypothetical protein
MKKVMILATVIAGFSHFALAGSGPQVTVLKSVEYLGKVVGQPKNGSDKVCKLVINLSEFTNQDHPNGSIKFQYVDFSLLTGVDLTSLNSKPVWQADRIARTNAESEESYSNESALPMKVGDLNTSSYDGHTLYGKFKRNDGIYTGKTEMWIKDVSPNVFDRKPTEVRILMKGGALLSTSTEADYSCQL